MKITVCLKWVPRRIVVDPLTASFEIDPRSYGPSPADEAALELALATGAEVTVACAGPGAADSMLRDALAAGAARAVRCDADGGPTSASVAEALAAVCRDADVVLCGDYSTDRGSGSVPAFLAAELGAAQMLGSVSVSIDGSGVTAERRLDRGRRSVLRAGFPAVVSVEGSVADLRRAPLSAVLAARGAAIEVGPFVRPGGELPTSAARPHRPRTKPRPVPSDAPPHVRILDITKATEERTPPRTLHLAPTAAAEATIEALREWGYFDSPGPKGAAAAVPPGRDRR